MTEVMINLRRSPRKLLERDGHPGPGPGHLALVMARAGMGKTAFLVDIGIDALLAGQRVLHISLDNTVERVRTRYDDVLTEMLRSEKKLEHWASIQLDVERRRHIQTYAGHVFSADRLRESLRILREHMHFEPKVIVMDELYLDDNDTEIVGALKEVAGEVGAELWLACQTFREAPASEGHLPAPADQFEDLVDMAFRLDPHESKVRLHILKDREKLLDEDLHILLDPQTQLLTVGLGS